MRVLPTKLSTTPETGAALRCRGMDMPMARLAPSLQTIVLPRDFPDVAQELCVMRNHSTVMMKMAFVMMLYRETTKGSNVAEGLKEYTDLTCWMVKAILLGRDTVGAARPLRPTSVHTVGLWLVEWVTRLRTLVVLGPTSLSLMTAMPRIPLVVLGWTRGPRAERVGGRVRTRVLVLLDPITSVAVALPLPSRPRRTAAPRRGRSATPTRGTGLGCDLRIGFSCRIRAASAWRPSP